MDQKTRKLMTMHKALHPRDDVDRLYVSRKKEDWKLHGCIIYDDSKASVKKARKTDYSGQ